MENLIQNARVLLIGSWCAIGCVAANAQSDSREQQPSPESAPTPDPAAAGIEASAAPETSDSSGESQSEAHAKLELRFTPYAWLTSYSGDLGAKGVSVGIDASFGDVMEASDTIFALMGAIDAKHDRLVFQLNGAYAQGGVERERGFASDGSGATVGAEIDASTSTFWLEGFAGYRVWEEPFRETGMLSLDAFGGLRHTQIEADLSVTTNDPITLPDGETLQPGTARSLSTDKSWVEPFIGARGSAAFGNGWQGSLRGDVGGFGVSDSSFSWQLIALAGYEWKLESGSLGLFGGYRALGQDYENDGFAWNVVTHGPVLGLSLRFDY